MKSPENGMRPQENPQDHLIAELNIKAQELYPNLQSEFRKLAIQSALQVVSIPQGDYNGLWTLAYELEERALQTKEGTDFLANSPTIYTWNKDSFRKPHSETLSRTTLASVLVHLDFIEKGLFTEPSARMKNDIHYTQDLAKLLTIEQS